MIERDHGLLNQLQRDGLLSAHERHVVDNMVSRDLTASQAVRLLDTVPADALAAADAGQHSYPYFDLDQCDIAWRCDNSVSGAVCRRLGFLPLRDVSADSPLSVVTDTPDDLGHRDAVLHAVGIADVCWLRCDSASLARALSRAYPDGSPLQAQIDSGADDAVGIVQQMLNDAVAQQASDIHVQPESGFARLRYRIDGVLETAAHLPQGLFQALCVRLKVLAELDVADSRSIQDGRFSAQIAGSVHRFRVSVLPTDVGESVVIRILLSHRRAPTLRALGVGVAAEHALESALLRHDGLVLMAGPTGSGKTTTLHALVERLRSASRNIITLEDPVEYTAPWLRQTSVNRETGLHYADGVRAALRQDPDVLLIGEMRDTDSAQMAFRASMTGHRVFSTVHASSAPAAVSRLRELGMASSVLASELNTVVAQRLLRRLCPHCKPAHGGVVVQGAGCTACAGRGYKGRFAVLEVLSLSGDVSDIIERGGSIRQLIAVAENNGFSPIAVSAWQAVQARETSVAEFSRVVGPPPGEVPG